MSPPVLLGPASVDRYVAQGVELPGGGALNMAYHWSRLGLPFHFLTRVGDDHAELFLSFMRRHGIEHSASVVAHGPSASIDIVIEDDRQPFMDHFVEGVWSDFRLTVDEEALVRNAPRLHVVLVEAVAAEVHRLGDAGALADVSVSGDFLSFRHYTVERFAATMAFLDVGIIGWPGALDDPVVAGVREVAFELGKLVVVTLGSRGVLVLDGRGEPDERFVAVQALPVLGTTVGCGDAFVAAFLARWWRDGDVTAAVESGKAGGAAATAWLRPLPDDAYTS
ncbi:MAG: carbohydrate kinase family protein [Actinomycetota bacterium]|nr:carbohydrate kinase family protein [Actinomycetota bacterium]